MKRPRVLLLDEPLSALDAKLRAAMQLELVRLQQTVGITFIIVTHDQDEALSMADRVAVMEAGKASYILCQACHGPNGQGMESMNAPNLTLQQDWYVVRQLMNFKSGVRGAGAGDTFGAQMVPMAATVADEQAAKNLAAYIATLGG